MGSAATPFRLRVMIRTNTARHQSVRLSDKSGREADNGEEKKSSNVAVKIAKLG
jgi:hypothetical protein